MMPSPQLVSIFHACVVVALFFPLPLRSNELSFQTFSTRVSKFLPQEEFNPLVFYSSFYSFKGAHGISVLFVNTTLLTSSTPSIIIPATITNISRFQITGNNTQNFSLVARFELSVHEIADIQAIVCSVRIVWSKTKDDNTPLKPSEYGILKWTIETFNHSWCPACRRFVSFKDRRLFNYDLISKKGASSEVVSLAIGFNSGLVILSKPENDFLAFMGWYGLVCGKYVESNHRWEWGCEPYGGIPVSYTNWGPGEPKYENDTACIYVKMPNATWFVADCDTATLYTLWQKKMKDNTGPLAGMVTFVGPILVAAVVGSDATTMSSSSSWSVESKNVSQYVDVMGTPQGVAVTQKLAPTKLVFALEPNELNETQNLTFVDASKGIVGAKNLTSTGGFATGKVYWAAHTKTDCSIDSPSSFNFIDPVRGICFSSNTARKSSVSITSEYDRKLFSSKSDRIALCSEGDGVGNFIWSCGASQGLVVDVYALWFKNVTTNDTEPFDLSGCLYLDKSMYRTGKCGDPNALYVTPQPLPSTNYGVVTVTVGQGHTSPSSAQSVSPSTKYLKSHTDSFGETTRGLSVAATLASSSTASFQVSRISLLGSVCNQYVPSWADNKLVDYFDYRTEADNEATAEYTFRLVNFVFYLCLCGVCAFVESIVVLVATLVMKKSPHTLFPPRLTLTFIGFVLPTLISSSLYLATYHSVSWAWVVFFCAPGVQVATIAYVGMTYKKWSIFSEFQWCDTQPEEYTYVDKFGFLYSSYTTGRTRFMIFEIIVSIVFSVVAGVPIRTTRSCVIVYAVQGGVLIIHLVVLALVRPGVTHITNACDVSASVLYTVAIVLRCLYQYENEDITREFLSTTNGLVFAGTVVSCVPLIEFFVLNWKENQKQANQKATPEEQNFIQKNE